MKTTTEIFLFVAAVFWLGPMCLGFGQAAVRHAIRNLREGRDDD